MLAFYVAILDTEEQKDKFTEIYTTYYGMMYQVARAITHDVEPASLHEDAADVVLTKMRLETTLKSLDEMPPVYRTALILRVQGYSIKEIAHITNSSAAAVKTRIHRARQLLLQNSQNDP